MVTKFDTPKLAARRRRRQAIVVIVSVVGFAGAIYFGSVLRERDPDYYQPARTALITARQRVEASYTHEAVLLEQLQNTHRELEAAIAALNNARVDPANQREVAILRSRLRALEDVERLDRTSPEQLQQSYREIEAQLSALIEKLERPKR